MKKLIVIAALIAASLPLIAQSPFDSIADQIARTNAELVRINKANNIQTGLIAAGSAFHLAGFVALTTAETNTEIRTATGLFLVGTVLTASSLLAMPKSVKLDGRGLVVSLPERKPKKMK